uniref:Heme chaperone HemW n=1 Tax=uncultured bacterium contig00030 TaxID=1181519 RepID=A0A806KM54_9BACT|nr:putative coproporphyrinogen III oxidase [uncultured bacterium contig00030]
MDSKSAGLYIHVPFCASFCDYCDFYSVAADETSSLLDSYVKAVIEDIKYQIEYFNVDEITTIYIGGGTPSVLGAERLEVLLDALKKLKPVEFSIEANPESVTKELLSVCREGGVNRLSAGVQSFYAPSRLSVNRTGNAEKLREQLELVSGFFPGAFSADLIAGLPFQSAETVLDDIKKTLDFNPAHVSLYSLAAEKDTPLENKIKAKEIVLADRDDADALWLCARDALKNAGFDHYEISNFALPGKYCLHNMNYWNMGSWLGAGPAASGTIINEEEASGKRFTYKADLQSYLKAPFIKNAVCEELDKTSLLKESLLMGFRLREGPDMEKFKSRFGFGIEDCIGQTLERWKGRDKMLFLNSFLSEAFLELEKPAAPQPDPFRVLVP